MNDVVVDSAEKKHSEVSCGCMLYIQIHTCVGVVVIDSVERSTLK